MAQTTQTGTIFVVLVRARARMLVNSVRAASSKQRIMVGGLSVFGLLFFALVCIVSALLIKTAQDGLPLSSGLTPDATLLVRRAYEYLFFFLLAGSVPFVAATLFQADDMPLLLTSPVDARAIVGAKLVDAAMVNAAQSAALGLPVLLGIGWAAGLSVIGWLWLAAATVLLLAVPPLATALLLLATAHTLGMRRVRAAVTVVSIGLGLAITCLAVLGASRAAQGGGLDIVGLQNALRGKTSQMGVGQQEKNLSLPLSRGEKKKRAVSVSLPDLLPSAWAAAMLEETAGGRELSADGWKGLGGLLLAAGLLTGTCLPLGARVLTSDAFLEPLDTGRAMMSPQAGRARWAHGVSLPTWGLLAKDARYLRRDLILLGQIGTALLLFLVPLLLRASQGGGSPADRDLYGGLALAMLGLILYMVTSIVSLTSVGIEGRGVWMVLASPVERGAFLRAKWLGAFVVSAGMAGILILVTWPLFGLGWGQVGAAFACLGPAGFALSGLGVGLAGLFPRFVYENPAHRASVWALLLGFVLATCYALLCGLIGAGAYLLPSQGILDAHMALAIGVGLFLALSLATGIVPVILASRRLRGYEWEF